MDIVDIPLTVGQRATRFASRLMLLDLVVLGPVIVAGGVEWVWRRWRDR